MSLKKYSWYLLLGTLEAIYLLALIGKLFGLPLLASRPWWQVLCPLWAMLIAVVLISLGTYATQITNRRNLLNQSVNRK